MVFTTALLLFIVSVHIGLIRRRGVAPPPGAEALEVPEDRLSPQPEAKEAEMATRTKQHPLRTWQGPERRYDLIAEGTIAVIVVAVLRILAASLWGSPDGGLTYPGAP